MVQILERVQAHYESREMPFGKVYEWHQAYVALECECGEKVTLTATSTITTCVGAAPISARLRQRHQRASRPSAGQAHPPLVLRRR